MENTKDDKPGQSVRIAGRKVHQFVTAACAFTGDTLFGGGIGKFFEGDAKDMFAALHAILKTVPPETSIFCGHEYTLQNLRWSRQVEIGNADLLAHSQRL